MLPFLDLPADSPFPIQNLPYGVFSRPGDVSARVGVAIGDFVVDLAVLEAAGLFDLPGARGGSVFAAPALNGFMALGRPAWRVARARLQDLLSPAGDPAFRDDAILAERAIHRRDDVRMFVPADIGDYTDFYASRQHATNVGAMFRGRDNALMPNWLHLPVGYHGRASSVVVSGTPVVRPSGQTRPDENGPPVYGPTRELDFELELGALIGVGNALGHPVSIDEAESHIFGYVLVNDWSARDIQRWEYVPLGPFLAKNFATTVSPWVVPADALEPFRVDGEEQGAGRGNPEPLPYLRQSGPRAMDITLEVAIESDRMRTDGAAPAAVCRTNARNLYWSFAQQVAHHTVNGCNLRPGDLLASGTISGDAVDAFGSMLELTWRGERPLTLTSGERRSFIEDGDRVVVSGVAQGDGYRIGFGDAEGLVQPARGSV